MIKVTRMIFLGLVLGTFAYSVADFFISPERRNPRILLYYHLVDDKLQGIRAGFSKRPLNSDQSVEQVVEVMLARPSVVFFRPLFSGNAQLERVQTAGRNVYVSLNLKENVSVEDADVALLKKVVAVNFPIFKEVRLLINGTDRQ